MPTLKPATPLPWFNDDEIIMPSLESAPFDDSAYDRSAQAWVADCRNGNGKANARYIIAACNAYPRLVAALQATVELGQLCADNCADRVRDVDFDNARALLRDLGEG